MKKFLAGLILGLVLATAPVALAAGRIRLIVDGRDVTPSDVAPQNINGRVMVPARALASALGATVGWDAELSAVVVSRTGPVADNLDPTQWISLRALMTDTSLTITAGDDLRITKGNTVILVSLVNSDNGNMQPILPLAVLVDGRVVRTAEARTDRTSTWLPIEILREFGIIQ